MPLDVVVLASTLVSSFLVPYASKGLNKIREELAETAGDAVSAGVEKVWSRVKSLFTSDREQLRWQELEEHPEDSAAMIQRTLQEKLEAQPALASELEQLVDQPVDGTGGATLQHIMAHNFGFVDVRNSHISGGTVAGLVINESAGGSGAAGQPAGSPPQDH